MRKLGQSNLPENSVSLGEGFSFNKVPCLPFTTRGEKGQLRKGKEQSETHRKQTTLKIQSIACTSQTPVSNPQSKPIQVSED